MDETPIEIVDHDPAWTERFEAERDRLETWIGEYTDRIEHVGSTSVPDLEAKPIVDVTAVVSDLSGLWGDVDKLTTVLEYEVSHQPADWLFLQRTDTDDQAYNLHLIERSHDAWKHDLLVREYLRANPEVGEEYEAVKREAAAEHPENIDAYNEAKGEFCRTVLDGRSPTTRSRSPTRPSDREVSPEHKP